MNTRSGCFIPRPSSGDTSPVSVPHTIDACRDRAARHALGELSPEEMRELEAHVAAGCEACARELTAYANVVADLALLVAGDTPASDVRQRVLAFAAGGAPPSRAQVLSRGISLIHSATMAWEECGIPGVTVKVLAVDEARGYRTSLVHMQPGARLPEHRHAGVEEVFLLEGDFTVEGVRLAPGDLCYSDGGSVHGVGATEGGCTFLAVASVRDEYRPASMVSSG